MLILWSFWQVHPRVTRRLQKKDLHSTTMYRTLYRVMLLYTTPLCRWFSQGYRSGRAAAHGLWMSGADPERFNLATDLKKIKWFQFFSNWKAQLPEWAAATVIQKQHILCLYYVYMHGMLYICQNLLWLKSGIQINPVSQAGGKALSPVREEREEEDPRLRLKSLE